MTIRVVIADDHPVVRDGLRMTLERSGAGIEVIGEAADGAEAIGIARKTPADVYILDVTMPVMNGIETTRELLRRNAAAKVIVLSLHDIKPIVEEAFSAGARGYLTKETATRSVVEAVTAVHAGQCYVCPAVAHLAVDALAQVNKAARARGAMNETLTRQERRVLQLVAEGYSSKEIASRLHVSANTVHSHRNSVMAKLNLHKQADLVHYAIKAGIAKL
ncbi:MAG: hypothetical protein A3G25_13875 [Betaproteobacteria bacterium RIFCSPLOWO2_12_FULL_63_13]|nr:MAG: hypothetical protein A3G25_13875 [Betaproteobacteria bacterium RIFCSPLOWO2_12_FULL_63_13]